MTITKLSLDTSIEMKTLVGEPILLKVGEVLWDDEISSCLMYGEIRPELWQRIWTAWRLLAKLVNSEGSVQGSVSVPLVSK